MFSQGYKQTALPTADKYQLKPPEAGSWTGNTSFSTSNIFTMTIWQTPSNYNDVIFIPQLELHTGLQTKAGITANVSYGCAQAQQTIWGVYLKTGYFSVSTLLCRVYLQHVFRILSREPIAPACSPTAPTGIGTDYLLSAEHWHHISLMFATLKRR